MQSKLLASLAIITFLLIGGIIGSAVLLTAITTKPSPNPISTAVNDSARDQDPQAPVRNADEHLIFQDITKYRDSFIYTQELFAASTPANNRPWGQKTDNWPIPSNYADVGTRSLLLSFFDHESLGIDMSYIGAQGPQSNIYPVYLNMPGTITSVSDNEDAVYVAQNPVPGDLNQCFNPVPIIDPPVLDNAYGSFVDVRNGRWVCLNYSIVYTKPDHSRYYNDTIRPAPDWEHWNCKLNSNGTGRGGSCDKGNNPCGDCTYVPKKEEAQCAPGQLPPCPMVEIESEHCEEKALCTVTVPAQSACIEGHNEFNDPANALRGHAIIKVPDWEIMISHLTPGDRVKRANTDDVTTGGSLAKLLLPRVFSIKKITEGLTELGFKGLLGSSIKLPADSPIDLSGLYQAIFDNPIGTIGTDGSSKSDREHYTYTPMLHYEVFRNLNKCIGGTQITDPIQMTSIDPLSVSIDPAVMAQEHDDELTKFSPPCFVPAGYADSGPHCADLLYGNNEGFNPSCNGINKETNGIYEGQCKSQFDELKIPTNKYAPDPDFVSNSSIVMPRVPGYEYPYYTNGKLGQGIIYDYYNPSTSGLGAGGSPPTSIPGTVPSPNGTPGIITPPDGKKGVDVSKWQGTSNYWPTLKANGIGFAFIKASEGVWEDSSFKNNWTWAKDPAVSIDRGAYMFFTPFIEGETDNDRIAQLQVDTLFRVVGSDLGELPIAVDVESSYRWAANINRTTSTIILRKVLNLIRTRLNTNPNFNIPIIYTNAGAWGVMTDGTFDAASEGYPLWIASWTTASVPWSRAFPASWTDWEVWQYGVGQMYGVGRIDLDVWNDKSP